jgi:hypothetical protein
MRLPWNVGLPIATRARGSACGEQTCQANPSRADDADAGADQPAHSPRTGRPSRCAAASLFDQRRPGLGLVDDRRPGRCLGGGFAALLAEEGRSALTM